MARNKRKNIKDREKLKGIRIEARKLWRKKKAKAKDLKMAIERTFEPEVKPKVVIAAELPVPSQNRPNFVCQGKSRLP